MHKKKTFRMKWAYARANSIEIEQKSDLLQLALQSANDFHVQI